MYGYGGVQGPTFEPAFDGAQKRRLLSLVQPYKSFNVVAIAFNFFVPWVLFCLIFAMFSFKMHYHDPRACWVITVVIAAVLGILIVLALLNFVKRRMTDAPAHESWGGFLYVTALMALILAAKIGQYNYATHMDVHYNLLALDSYTDIDPSSTRGQEIMDAGLVTWAQGSRVDVNRWISFTNKATYCVAPLTTEPMGSNRTVGTYDFFAVGKDCCMDATTVFACAGDHSVSGVSGGVRVLNENDRAFYKLAVQQLEAAYNVKARNPIFFKVVEDPEAAVHELRLTGYSQFLTWMIAYFFFQMFLVFIMACTYRGG